MAALKWGALIWKPEVAIFGQQRVQFRWILLPSVSILG